MTHIALFNLGGSSDLTADTDQKRLPSGNRSPQQIAKCASSKVAWVSKELAPNPNASVRRNFELQSTGISAMEERMLKSSSVATARHNSTSISSQSSSYIASIGEKRFQATKPAHHAAPITMSSLSKSASMVSCSAYDACWTSNSDAKPFFKHLVYEPQSLARRSHPKSAFPFVYQQKNTRWWHNYPSCFSGYTSFTLYVDQWARFPGFCPVLGISNSYADAAGLWRSVERVRRCFGAHDSRSM